MLKLYSTLTERHLAFEHHVNYLKLVAHPVVMITVRFLSSVGEKKN